MTTDELLQRWSDGSITTEELRELTAKLAEPEHHGALLDDWLLESSLPDRLTGASVAGLHRTTMTRWTGWLSWRPITAAAAGIVFWMLCTSVVFGFGARSVEKVLSLLQESFESGPAPLVTGMPQEVNLWSGDYSEIVETYDGVKPMDGTKMARMLRSDFKGKTSSRPSKQGDLMRVVDVRPFLREANGCEVVVTLSALFNAAPFPEAERYDGAVYLYALGQLGSTEESLLEDALAHSHGGCRSLDRDPATWQRASARLLLPPGTEMVLLKVSFTPVPASGKNLSSLPDHVTFAGHFVDDVRASVTIRRVDPRHQNEALP